MAMCDYGMASTVALAEHMTSVVRTGSVFVQRNGIDSRLMRAAAHAVPRNSHGSRIRIFYGSATLAHNKDFNDIAIAALLPLMKQNPSVSLVIVGHLDLHPDFGEVADQVMRVDMIPDPESYWQLLSECDINIAALADTPMNDCKSEIKWLEAAVLGVPSVVSSTATYRAVVDNGQTGLVAATLDDWTAAVRRLASSVEERRRIGEQARDAATIPYSPNALSRNLLSELRTPMPVLPASAKKRVLIVNVFYPPQAIWRATPYRCGSGREHAGPS